MKRLTRTISFLLVAIMLTGTMTFGVSAKTEP